MKIDKSEEKLLQHILALDFEEESNRVEVFRKKYLPYAGNASATVVDKLLVKLLEPK